MQLVEIRDLDGPNLFFLEPAIKVELKLEDGESEASLASLLEPGSTVSSCLSNETDHRPLYRQRPA